MTGYVTQTGNRLMRSPAADGTYYEFSYDDEGNMVTKTHKATDGQVLDTSEFMWDYRNRLTDIKVRDANGTVLKEVTYRYDVNDQRIQRQADSNGDENWDETTKTVYDGENPYADFDANGDLIERYLYGPEIDMILARIRAIPKSCG